MTNYGCVCFLAWVIFASIPAQPPGTFIFLTNANEEVSHTIYYNEVILTFLQRKSAGQTLFSTIAAHGSLLATQTWQAVLWQVIPVKTMSHSDSMHQVLFPLLDKVAIESGLASTEKSGDSLLIHHSRNTEQKQWSETQASCWFLKQLFGG